MADSPTTTSAPPTDGLARLDAAGVRLEGISVAGEQTFVTLPDLSVSFDIGLCPPPVLTADTVALTHGHADHAAGLLYYMAQRYRTRMGPGTVVCHPELTDAIRQLALCGAQLEGHTTPVHVVGLRPGAELVIGEGVTLRGFETHHTVPSLGFVIETPGGDRPTLAYTGDTTWGACFQREDLLAARVLVTECTFLRREHRRTATVSGHLHLDHVRALVQRSAADTIVLTHLPRQLPVHRVRQIIRHAVHEKHHPRLALLMDHVAVPAANGANASAEPTGRAESDDPDLEAYAAEDPAVDPMQGDSDECG